MALSTPAAIVVGCAIIGVCVGAGVYFALRPRAPVTALTAGTGEAASSAPTVENKVGEAPPVAPEPVRPAPAVPSSGLTSRVSDEAAAQFNRAREGIVKKCIDESTAGPAVSHFRMHLIVDGQGEQLGRSFLESGAARTGLAQCANAALPSITVTPPGARVTVEVPVTLP
jgi:hypothetical protein